MGVVASQLRKKNIIRYNGEVCIILEATVRNPPNNRAYFQMEIRTIKTGRFQEIRCTTTTEFEVLENRTQNLEFSYENRGVYVFVDQETYEPFEIPNEIIKDQIAFLVVGNSYEVLFIEGNPIQVNLPGSVEMTVTETADAVRGNTASNVTKDAVLETGLSIRVPMFIKLGDKVRVNVEDKSYLGRV